MRGLLAAQAAGQGDPAVGGLYAVLIVSALIIWWRIDLHKRPWLPCRTCNGAARDRSRFREDAWGPCPRCDGTGRRPRRWTDRGN